MASDFSLNSTPPPAVGLGRVVHLLQDPRRRGIAGPLRQGADGSHLHLSLRSPGRPRPSPARTPSGAPLHPAGSQKAQAGQGYTPISRIPTTVSRRCFTARQSASVTLPPTFNASGPRRGIR